jgi:hypothetical protein
MKRFKEIYHKTLKEEYTEGGSVFNGYSDSVRRTAQSDFGVHRVGEGDSIHRLNAFINKFLGGTYIDPEAAVTELRSRLNHAGLDFVFDGKKITLHPGVNSFPAKLYGEVFGTTPTTDLSKGFDKGMDLPGLNLVIDVTYDETSCMYSMSGKLIPTPKTSPTTPMKEGAFGKMAGTFLGNMLLPGVGGVIGGMLGSAAGDAVSSATANDAQANGRASAMGENGMKRKKKIKKTSEDALAVAMSEEKIEHVSDFPRKVEHFIMRDKDMKDKVLVPVFNHLLSKKKKGKLTLDDARKELYFVVNSALRKMKDTVEGDEKREVTLTQKEKGRVVGDLVRNFKKYMTTHAKK